MFLNNNSDSETIPTMLDCPLHFKVEVTGLLLTLKNHFLMTCSCLGIKYLKFLQLIKDTSLSSLQVISFSVHRNNGVFQLMYAFFKFGQDFQL